MFKLNELLKATGGKLISGRGDLLAQGISIDSRTVKKGEAFIAIKGDNFDGHDFIDAVIKKGATCIISRQRTMHNARRATAFIQVQDTRKALGDLACFQRNKFSIPVIAVTGSNGKTTTKEMVAWVLSKRYNTLKNEGTQNNQIGLPLTLLNLKPEHEAAVLEVGTNHFGEVSALCRIAQPNIGIITNIGPAHLLYFSDLSGVWREKSALLRNLKGPRLAILNADDARLRKRLISQKRRPVIFGFGIKKRSDFFASDIRANNQRIEFLVNRKYKFNISTAGRYNIYNALAAIAAARLLGLGYKDIASGMSSFVFPASRFNLLILHNTRFIDDTYNSNPFSLKEALDTLANLKVKGRKILLMGDMLELGAQERLFHSQAGRDVASACDVLVSVGRLSRLTAGTAQNCGLDSRCIFTCENSQEARRVLFNKISPKKDDVVLVKGSRLMKMEEVFHAL